MIAVSSAESLSTVTVIGGKLYCIVAQYHKLLLSIKILRKVQLDKSHYIFE